MAKAFFPRIRRWPWSPRKNSTQRQGAVTLLTVLLFFVFTSLGLGMLYLTRVYMEMSAYRRNTSILEYASENGIKQGYQRLLGLLNGSPGPVLTTDGEVEVFRTDAEKGGDLLAEKVLGGDLPFVVSGTWGNMEWEGEVAFEPAAVADREEYFQVDYAGRVSATGRMKRFSQEKASHLVLEAAIFAGHIPLTAFPFLVDKSMSPAQKREFLEQVPVEIFPLEEKELPPSPSFSDGDVIPDSAATQVADALKIKIFRPQDLSPSRLRTVLGLESGTDPIPDGVYLIKDDLGLGGIFVQGDLEEIILAIDGGYQVIFFRSIQGTWMLRFSLEKAFTVFTTPQGAETYDFVPLGIVIVNGEILSLGGGYVDSEGRIMMTQEKIPCLLRGFNLTIVASEEIHLTSHLMYQGVRWVDGVPYVKDSDAQFILMTTGNDILDGRQTGSKILVDKESPGELEIHAALTAGGEGIEIRGKGKSVRVLGSVHASEMILGENRLLLKFDERFFYRPEFLTRAPRTSEPVLWLSRLRIKEWSEEER